MFNQQIGRYLAQECLILSASGSNITSSYKPLTSTSSPMGTLTAPGIQFFIQNLTDHTVWISLDGSTNNFPLVSGGYFVDDIKSNQADAPINMIFYGKTFDVQPTSGGIYCCVFYSVGG